VKGSVLVLMFFLSPLWLPLTLLLASGLIVMFGTVLLLVFVVFSLFLLAASAFAPIAWAVESVE
jgi:hypothetical protein